MSHAPAARAHFDGALWDAAPTPWEAARVAATVALAPAEARLIVDVGGGDGRVARTLTQGDPHRRVLLLDGAQGALRRAAPLPRARCEVDHLPLPDASADLVTCCEVLEHLPHPTLERALDELWRVSRRHVLLTVPNDEDLRLLQVRCPACRHVFHGYGHLHRFTADRLRTLLPGCVHVQVLQKPQPLYHPALYALRTRALGRYAYYPHATCPACGHADFRGQRRDPVRRAIGGLNHLLTGGRTRPGGHLLALFDKRAAP